MSRLIDADELLGMLSKGYETKRALDLLPTVDPWKYPSKEGYPDEDVECLVYTTSGHKFIAIRDSSDKCWCTGEFFDEFLRDDCVIAWQYIVPPKEEA